MDNNDLRILIDTFKGYRDLLNPIQNNLHDFAETYNWIKSDIEKLNSAFEGDIKGNLEKIYKNLSSQAEKATDLSSRIEQFISMSDKYTQGVNRFITAFEKVNQRIESVNALENRAEEQIGKLDAIIEEKKKSYNIKELQKTLESYNDNVQKVSEFINKDVAESLNENYKKLENIKGGNDNILKRIQEENISIENLLGNYKTTNELLRTIIEKEDVNEAYIFDILDKWAEARKVKTKKQER